MVMWSPGWLASNFFAAALTASLAGLGPVVTSQAVTVVPPLVPDPPDPAVPFLPPPAAEPHAASTMVNPIRAAAITPRGPLLPAPPGLDSVSASAIGASRW